MKKRLIAVLLMCCLLFPAILAGCQKSTPPTGGDAAQLPAELDPIDDNYRVFYQIFVGSFSDSDGDGVGDLRGVINRLDYLNDGNVHSGKSLGVQGIWLSPIFTSPSYHKYDAADYYQIDPAFGTKEDLLELLRLCHARNVKVILDLAINHSSTKNAWFEQFKLAHQKGDVNDPYYDFYVYAGESERVAGHTYYRIPGCLGEYYEGNFDSGMPEFNFDNPAVRAEMVALAKHYLDMGVDGFRFDAIKYIYYQDTAASAAFWEWYMGELRAIKPDIYTVGECWSADAEVLKYYGATNCFNFTSSQLGQIYLAANSGDASAFTKYAAHYQESIRKEAPDAMYCPFIANHDTDRAAGFLPVTMGKMQMAANLYILCHGSPFLYYGEEIGMKGSRGAANTDANRRLAMLWGDDDTVKDPQGSTYARDKQSNGTVASQLEDENSLLHYYMRLIALRNKYPAIARGTYTALECEQSIGGFSIAYDGAVIGLFHNASEHEIAIPLPAGAEALSAVADFIGSGAASLDGNTLTIGARTSVILK